MGGGSHSSKRKKKRSKKRGKKTSKSIREKTKKLKRRHDSVSLSDDDNSASTSSVSRSDSSSEGSYRSKRRARCRDKKGTRKGSKKKMRMDSSMSDSSGDSRRIKKRKRLKSKWDFDSKKNRHRKKRRREPSSSSSDRSMSCSRSEATDDSTEVHRKDDRWELKERDEKDGEKSRTKRSRYSSRSCSPCGLQSKSHSYGSEDGLRKENPPNRLKSVIVVMREIEEVADGSNRDEHKDEIIYEHDDYPTRSNDSNDVVSRGDVLLSSYDANDEKTMCLEEPNGEAGSSDARIAKVLRIQRPGMEKTDAVASSSIELRVGDHLMGNRSEVSTADVSSSSVDLEAMLRQKALQNLLKCQGRLPTKIDGGNQGDHHSKVKNPNVGGSFESTRKIGRNDDVKHGPTVPVLPEDTVAHPPIRNVETGLPVEKANPSANPVISRHKLGLSTSTRRLLGASNTWRRDPTSQHYPRPTLPTPKEAVNKESAKVTEPQSSDTKTVTEKADRASASELPPSGGKNTEDEANEAVEDSEFEQKTMTVMRGGELVQVSYKVKIPKKAPALARRQLKR